MKQFRSIGKKVMDPEQFVGRVNELEIIEKKILNENILIAGLPRMGKSSLAYQAILKVKQKYKSIGKPIIDVWFDVSQTGSPKEFFNQLIRQVHTEICSIIREDKKEQEEARYKNAITGRFDAENTSSYFLFIDKLSIPIIICLDEFDAVRNIKLERKHFGCLHKILDGVRNITTIITSRRLLINIEKEICKNANPSKLHSLYNTQFYLRPYTPEELNLYWEQISPYFKSCGLNLTKQYIENSAWYSGNVPYFLDKYNDFFMTGTKDSDVFLYMMNQIFNDMTHILEEQNLLQAALQVIIGPFYDCKQEDILDLKRYGFLIECEPNKKEEKFAIYDSELKDGKTYICFSDYFTRRLKSEYKLHAHFWPEFDKVRTLIRRLVTDYINQNAGDNWEIDKTGPFWKQLVDMRNKDVDMGIPASPKLSDYYMERDLVNIISSAWETFKPVFSLTREEFIDMLNEIMHIRNHHAHGNLKTIEKNKMFLEERTLICIRLSERLSLWFSKSNGNLCDLSLKNLCYSPYIGTIERDGNGCYHVGPFSVAKNIGEPKVGEQVRVMNASFNTFYNNGYLYFASKLI